MNNSFLIIHIRVFSNLYFQVPPHIGSLQTVTKVATYYDRAEWSFLYLVIL